MNTSTVYTPLERLLLFQSLLVHGTEDQDFDQISDLLTNNSLVKDGETYDTQRLTSNALRQLYFGLLQDELRSEGQDGYEEASQPATRKRKLPSPPVLSVKDTREYRDKLPSLVDRLYARYQDEIIRAIREDEDRFADLRRQIGQIERGELNDPMFMEDDIIVQKNGSRSPLRSEQRANGTPMETPTQEKRLDEALAAGKMELDQPEKATSHKPPPQELDLKSEGLPIGDVLNRLEVTSSPKPSDPPQTDSNPVALPPNHQKSGNNVPQNQPHLQAGLQQLSSQLPNSQQPSSYKWENTYGPQQLPQYQSPGQFNQYSQPTYNQSTRGAFPAPHPYPSHSPVTPSQNHPPHPLGILLPPPNVNQQSPISPAMPLEALADAAGQVYRAPSGSSMIQKQATHQPQHYLPHFSPQQQRSPGSGPSQWNQLPYTQPLQPPHQSFNQYPPNHSTQHPQFQPPVGSTQPENKQYTSPYHPNQGPRPPITSQNHTPRARQSFPNTPVSRGPPRYMTGTGTMWTPTASTSTPKDSRTLPQPEVEQLSPVIRPVTLPSIKKIPKNEGQKVEKPKPTKPSRRGVQSTRAGSTPSSVVAPSNRSQSVISNTDADELSMDADITSRHVKEEVATPKGIEDIGDVTVDEVTFPTLPSRSGPSPRQSTKRKRAPSIGSESRAPLLPAHVIWTRAFPKISASALESISGHKNASMFSAPVKERDALGYKDLVLRPQDLKSIRSAITAGHRAATAAAPDDMPASASSCLLPISKDLIPPKGIINYAQLEKELMRMFANAVMFNQDPDRGFGRKWQGIGKGKEDIVGYEIDEDSLVKDTRAMFSDVEKIVGSLRSAERRSEETRDSSVAAGNADDDEMDELARDGESHAGNSGSIAKRRRKA